eukprot:s5608_g5.t1
MHNLHSKLDGTGLSGREVLRNQVDRKNAVTAMFCSRVLAETPDSVNSIGRFVTAGYLYPVRNSFAHFVVAMIEGTRHSAECRKRQAEFLTGTAKPSLDDLDLERYLVAPEGDIADAPYSPSLGPEEPVDVDMELPPEVSSAPAEAASSAAAEQSAPEVVQEDVAMDFEATDHREPMDISMMLHRARP